MIDAIIQDRFTCVSKPATMRSPVLLRPVGQWIGAGSGSSDSFSPRPTAFQIGGDPSCESPQRGQKHDALPLPPRQPGRLIARKHRKTRPAYSPKVFYFAGRPTEAESLCSTRHRSEEHTSELQSLMRISYAVFCLQKKTT